MSDDTLNKLLGAIPHGDELLGQLLQGDHGPALAQIAKAGLPDRKTISDRRFWTGAAIGAVAVLVLATAKRGIANDKVTARDADVTLRNGAARKPSGLF